MIPLAPRMRLPAVRLVPSALNMPGENKIEQNQINSPESVASSNSREVSVEKKIESIPNKVEAKKSAGVSPDAAAPAPAPALSADSSYRDKQIEEIENIMSAGLDQVFLQMSPEQQKKFKEEGEKTANRIEQLLNKAKTGADKIIALIKRWLRLIPHVNKFFLEQEAKIKADKILKIKNNL